MKYVLRKADQSDELELAIDQDAYTSCKESRNILLNCLALEESYQVLILAYLDLERQIFDATASNMVYEIYYPSSDTFDIRLALNLRLMSLLTAITLYRDRFPHYIKECLPHRTDAESLAKSFRSREYDDDKLDYQFMELFRNHAQHFDLPIHWMSSGTRWTELGKDGLLEYSTDFGVSKSYIMENKKFTRRVLNKYPDEIDLKSTTRNYVESFSKMHGAARELIKESVQKARQNIEDAYRQYRKVYGEASGSLSAHMLTEQGVVETVPLMLYLDDIRMKLQKKNQTLIHLDKRYVTGKKKKTS
jgi:hypothetical protein